MFVMGAVGILGLLAFTFRDEVGLGNSQNEPKNWRRFDSFYQHYGTLYKVPWTWLKAIALNESDNGNYPSVALGLREPSNIAGSTSQDKKSWGVMQMIISTARGVDPKGLAGLTDAQVAERLNNPEYSIKLGAQYVSQLSTQFSKLDLRYMEWVIKSYNQGPGNTRKEIAGTTKGYAQEYWSRFQRNLEKVERLK